MKIGAEEAELAELRDQMLRESGFAAVLLDDGDDFVFHELARCLAHQFFLIIELRIEIDEVHTAIAGHKRSWEQISLAKKGQSAPAGPGKRVADLTPALRVK